MLDDAGRRGWLVARVAVHCHIRSALQLCLALSFTAGGIIPSLDAHTEGVHWRGGRSKQGNMYIHLSSYLSSYIKEGGNNERQNERTNEIKNT